LKGKKRHKIPHHKKKNGQDTLRRAGKKGTSSGRRVSHGEKKFLYTHPNAGPIKNSKKKEKEVGRGRKLLHEGKSQFRSY